MGSQTCVSCTPHKPVDTTLQNEHRCSANNGYRCWSKKISCGILLPQSRRILPFSPDCPVEPPEPDKKIQTTEREEACQRLIMYGGYCSARAIASGHTHLSLGTEFQNWGCIKCSWTGTYPSPPASEFKERDSSLPPIWAEKRFVPKNAFNLETQLHPKKEPIKNGFTFRTLSQLRT